MNKANKSEDCIQHDTLYKFQKILTMIYVYVKNQRNNKYKFQDGVYWGWKKGMDTSK